MDKPLKPLDTIEKSKPEQWVFSNDDDDDRSASVTRTPLPPLPPKNKIRSLWILAPLLIIVGIVSAYYFFLYLPSQKKDRPTFKQTEEINVKEKEIIIEKTKIDDDREELKRKEEERRKEEEEKKKERELKKKKAAAARKEEHERILKKKDDDAFKQAISRNVFYSYEKYLKMYPSGLHAEDARKRLNDMKYSSQLENKVKDDVAFETASKSQTIVSYQEYLKQFPYGAHASEAKTRIDFLGQKLIRETKVKIDVVSIKFFESGSTALPVAQRNYSTRFSKETARYIYTEISFKNKLVGVSAASGAVTLQFNDASGPYTQPLKGRIDSDIDEMTGIYSRGLGFSTPGKWQKGAYTVTIYIDGVEAGKSRFDIY